VIDTPGLRLSVIGGIVVGVSLVALALLPDTVPAAAMMIGGVAVIAGFIWSLAHFYLDSPGE
jgi:hypothetical protein